MRVTLSTPSVSSFFFPSEWGLFSKRPSALHAAIVVSVNTVEEGEDHDDAPRAFSNAASSATASKASHESMARSSDASGDPGESAAAPTTGGSRWAEE